MRIPQNILFAKKGEQRVNKKLENSKYILIQTFMLDTFRIHKHFDKTSGSLNTQIT